MAHKQCICAECEDTRRRADLFDALCAELEVAAVDSLRLDFLDRVNAALNRHYGTTYGWKYDVNHNRCKISLEDSHIPALSVRAALDKAMGSQSDADAEVAPSREP